MFGYSQHYAGLRGRPFRGPGKPIHYVGRIGSLAARRTKPRRLSASAFAEGAAAGGVDGFPTEPTPVPDELTWSFTEAVWRSLPCPGRRAVRTGRLRVLASSGLTDLHGSVAGGSDGGCRLW